MFAWARGGLTAAVLSGLLLLVPPAALAGAGNGLPTAQLELAGQTLTVEIAADHASQRRGLMHREHLPADHGMLFVWEEPARRGMWMKNTLIPLDVAFIDADFEITNIETMEPQTTRLHSATRGIVYALEVNAGWFEQHGIVAGDRLPGLSRVLDTLD